MLCDDCQKSYNKWLKPRQLFIENRLDYIGRNTPKEREMQGKERADRWYKTVNFQLNLIIRICQEKHKPGQQLDGQLDLLEEVAW